MVTHDNGVAYFKVIICQTLLFVYIEIDWCLKSFFYKVLNVGAFS